MRVFVTGGTGVLGQPTMRLLVARGHAVTALVRNQERAPVAQALGATPIIGDLFDPEFIHQAVGRSDSVLHLATAIPKKIATDAKDWVLNDRIRREGTLNLLHAAESTRLHSFVIQSIAFLYGDTRGEWKGESDSLPRSLASSVRSAVEMENAGMTAYREHKTPVVILRGASFYGPTAYNTREMLNAIKHRRLPILGSGEQYWHWIYAVDMARACVMVAERPFPGETFNVADDWAFHARDGLDYIAAQLNAPAPFKMSVLLGRALGGSTATFLAQSARYRTDKIKKLLGWTPAFPTYREGLADIFRLMGKRT